MPISLSGRSGKNGLKDSLKSGIRQLEAELTKLLNEKKQLPEKVDVSTLENYNFFKKIDNEGKNLFDFVTASVIFARSKNIKILK